jgi:hypothetical protein
LLPLATIFRPDNVFTDVARAEELADLTGLPLTELVAFRPQRLALHELLIRVTADFTVPDGSAIGDLGINFREIVRDLLARCIEPQMDAVIAAYASLREELARVVEHEIAIAFGGNAAPPPTPKPRGGFLERLGWKRDVTVAVKSDTATGADVPDAEIAAAARAAVARVIAALTVRHGALWGSRELVASLATDLACNDFGSERIGRLIDPWLQRAAAEVPYRLLPPQAQPVVMNTKGASASGKSTLRPLQKRLAGQIGVDWQDFALISPDIWRKQLIDYGALGDAYRYAGAFSGEELSIVDQKLDRYMARKAARGRMSHLLIDRFRFDSFAADSEEAGSNLLTRFGRFVYLFFMITPPASLVERAWNRGLEFGRYKAVDDTLAHSVEAYSGMPQLFFTWVKRIDKRVHFEFLDNSVRSGEPPRTVAFGWNTELNVLDVKCLLDVERYRRVDVDARSPDRMFADASALAAAKNTGFLCQCVARFATVNFADSRTGRVYLHVAGGTPVWADPEGLASALADPETRAGLAAAVPDALTRTLPAPDAPAYLRALDADERRNTLGAWGA